MDKTMYLPGDNTQDLLRRSNSRQNDVLSVQLLSPRNRLALKLLRSVAVNAQRKIHREEKLYVIYSSGYTFTKIWSNSEDQ